MDDDHINFSHLYRGQPATDETPQIVLAAISVILVFLFVCYGYTQYINPKKPMPLPHIY